MFFFTFLVSVDSDDIPGIGQYDDFHTIDWQRDIARDRMRHRYIVKKKHDSIWGLIKGAHDAWSGWLCVLFVGLFTGVAAGVIDIGASWMTDLKFGICPQAFWLNKEQCCWAYNETTFNGDNCSQVSRFPTFRPFIPNYCFCFEAVFSHCPVFLSVVNMAPSIQAVERWRRALYHFLHVLYCLGPAFRIPFGVPSKNVRPVCVRLRNT